MATTTTRLGLTKPGYNDTADIEVINDNMDVLDDLSGAMAIIVYGDTAPQAISNGQYMFITGHSTLAAGLYHATAAISSGASISSSNVAADSDGIANALNSNLVSKSQIKNNLTTTTTGDVLDAKMGRELKLYLNALAVASLIYTFTGTGSTSVTLDYNAQNYAFTMALVLDSNNDVIGTAFVNPVIANNRDIKIYCGSTTCWGSFKLTNNGAKCTFNRTTANTASVLLYGVGSKSL